MFLPICVVCTECRHQSCRGVSRVCSEICFAGKSAILITIKQVVGLTRRTKGNVSIIRNARRRLLATFFRCNDNDAITCAATVNSSCTGIFQHRIAGNIFRVNHRKGVGEALYAFIIHSQTVDNDQRVVRSVERGATTDADLRPCTRLAAFRRHINAGYFADQHILRARCQTFGECVGFQSGHGAGCVRLLHLCVADYHSFGQVVVFFQDDFQVFLRLNRHGFITDIGNTKRSTLLRLQGKVTVVICIG